MKEHFISLNTLIEYFQTALKQCKDAWKQFVRYFVVLYGKNVIALMVTLVNFIYGNV